MSQSPWNKSLILFVAVAFATIVTVGCLVWVFHALGATESAVYNSDDSAQFALQLPVIVLALFATITLLPPTFGLTMVVAFLGIAFVVAGIGALRERWEARKVATSLTDSKPWELEHGLPETPIPRSERHRFPGAPLGTAPAH